MKHASKEEPVESKPNSTRGQENMDVLNNLNSTDAGNNSSLSTHMFREGCFKQMRKVIKQEAQKLMQVIPEQQKQLLLKIASL